MRGRTFVTRLKNVSGPGRKAGPAEAMSPTNQKENNMTTLDHSPDSRRAALTRLTAAAAARDAAEDTVLHAAMEARAAGATLAEIGKPLGLTHSGAHRMLARAARTEGAVRHMLRRAGGSQ